MQVWAEHQQKTTQDGGIKCPMCREDFGPIELLKAEMRNAGGARAPLHGVRMDRHLGIACGHCSTAPIEGKCYRYRSSLLESLSYAAIDVFIYKLLYFIIEYFYRHTVEVLYF